MALPALTMRRARPAALGFVAIAQGDGHDNEERKADVRDERACGQGAMKTSGA
jgi:hypothetical protein